MINYMRKEYNLMIGDSTAEKIKKEIGTAIPQTITLMLLKVEILGQEHLKKLILQKRIPLKHLMVF